jgi:hypothetical protein
MVAVVCVLSGCAPVRAVPTANAPARDREARAAASADHLRELTALLPSGADRCVLARPERLAPERRPLLVRLSQADALAWLPEPVIAAYASVQRERRDGPSGQVTLLYVDAPEAVARAVLDARSGLALEWSNHPEHCTGAACGAQAEFITPRIVRIVRGAYPAQALAGVEVGCRDMAERSAQALELSVSRGGAGPGSMPGAPAARAITELRATAQGVVLTREDILPGLSEAERRAHEQLADEVPSWPVGVISQSARHLRTDTGFRTEIDVLWEDLEFAADDDARALAAEQRATRQEQTTPSGADAATAIEDVLAELGFRLSRMRESRDDERRGQALAARALLERALARDPGDEGLRLMLVELLLSEFKEPRPAHMLLYDIVAGCANKPQCALLRRHAAALEGESALAAALAHDGLAIRARARTLAREILDRMHVGRTFEQAERDVVPAPP